MAIPNHWNVPFTFSNVLTAITDVQDLMDEISDVLLVDLPVGSRWTNTSGTNYDSGDPEDAGRKVTMELLRDSAAVMSVDHFDQSGITLRTGSVSWVGGSANFEIYAGEAFIDIINTTDQELNMCGIIDNTPAAQGSTTYAYSVSRRDNTGSLVTTTDIVGEVTMIDNTGSAASDDRLLGRYRTVQGGAIDDYVWPDGSIVYSDCRFETETSTSVFRMSGRMYQHVQLTEDGGAVGSDHEIAIDDAVNGTFRIIPPSTTGTVNHRWACRR